VRFIPDNEQCRDKGASLQCGQGWNLTSFREKQTATIPDRHLGCLGETLQQPRQCDFQPGMILRDIEMTGRCLPQRAHAKKQAITLPSFLIDLKHRYAGGRARQACLKAARSLFTA
jgi:hypothetical protein